MDVSAEEHTGPAPRRRSPRRIPLATVLLVPVLSGGVVGTVFRGTDHPAVAVAVNPAALANATNIPLAYLTLYQQAAGTCAGLRWEFLAAIGKLESDHGRAKARGVSSGENPWGAAGPMQFLAATWRQYGTSDINDRYDPAKAIPAAARFLCAIGASKAEFRAASNYYAGPYATGKARASGDAYATNAMARVASYVAIAGRSGGASPPPPGTTTTPATTIPKKTTTKAPKPPDPPVTTPTTRAKNNPTTPPAPTTRSKIPPASISGYVIRAKG